MNIVLDLTSIQDFFALPLDAMFWQFFFNFGWMILAILYLVGAAKLWLIYKKDQYAAKINYIFLAIDVPRGNEQTPRGVENMFSYLAGGHGSINFYEKWFEGKFQVAFSYEVVSIEGYTQFIVRTPIQFRDLVESSVYSQYPDAEISEVDDYTEGMPKKFPDDQYDVWGSEFIQATHSMFPIKQYREFEHQLGPSEMQFKDSMASLMDLCGSLGSGEQFWYQIIVVPIGFDWMKAGDDLVDKLLNKKPKTNSGFLLKFVEWLGEASEGLYSIWQDVEKKDDPKKDDSLSMIELNPKQKKQIEAIHMKIAKLAFEVKIRVVYMARKEVMQPSKVANGIIGYMKQFAALDLNNLMPDVTHTMTRADYFRRGPRVLRKKNNIVNNYIKRDVLAGRNAGIMNIEELATLWHFPVEGSVQASLLQKAPGRKAGAPSSLPFSESFESEDDKPDFFTEDNGNDNGKSKLDEILESEDNRDLIENGNEEEEFNKEINITQEEKTETPPANSKGGPPSNLPFV